MLTRADLSPRFTLRDDGLLVHVPLEGVFLIPLDDLPEVRALADKALGERKPVDMTARME